MQIRVAAWVVLLATSLPPAAWPQASGPGRLESGGFGVASGASASAGRVVVGEMGGTLAATRSSSVSADLVGGFTGSSYSSQASLAFETIGAEFVSVAFPLRPVDAAVTSVLDELGPPDRRFWRLGHWSPAESSYVEAAGLGLASVERGRGYFLITLNPVRVVESGLSAPVGDFTIELEDGPAGRPAYNQLGNPFLFPVAVADLRVTDGTTTWPLAHPENPLTETSVKIYDVAARGYASDRTTIDSRAAFWVKKIAPGPVRLIVPFRAAAPAPAPTGPAKPATAHWAVAVTLEQDGRSAEPLIVGAAPVAKDGWNALCASRAPDPPGGGIGLVMRETGWGRWSGEYVRVFRRPAETMSWDLAPSGVQSPGEFVLAFADFDLPAGARMVLSDPVEGWTREITSGERVTIAARGDHRLRLTVTMDPAAIPASRIADGLRRIHPNPFSSQCGLVFGLAGAAPVDVRIYDAQGRAVRRLAGRGGAAGERVLVWDGRDDEGRLTSPGVYLARWNAGTARGVSRIVKLSSESSTR